MPINWYKRTERREVTEGYIGYMQFDIAFVSWVKVLLDLLKLSNFLSLDPVPPKIKLFVFDFRRLQMIEFEERFFKVLSPF